MAAAAVFLLAGVAPPSLLRAQATPDIVFPNSAGIQLKNEDMSAAALNKAQQTGAKFVRKGIYWDSIETSPGVFNWTQVDGWISGMETRGFSMIVTIVWNNRDYEDIWDRAIVTEPGRQAFANFVSILVQRYQGKPIIWEIWNEPNLRSFWHENAQGVSNTDAMAEEYTALVKVAVPAMKAADPDCRVVAGSISALWTDSFNWFDRCIEVGLLTVPLDGISVHPYGFQWPELAASGYATIRQKLDAAGATDLPIINSEVGFDEVYLSQRGIPAAQLKDAQAWSYVRQNIVDAMSNVQVTNWYELTDPVWGVVNTDLSTRPTFTAAQVMCAQLAGYHFKERIALPSPLDYAVVFENNAGQMKMVAWTTPDRTLPAAQRVEVAHSVSLPVGAAGSYVITGIYGAASSLSTATDHLAITLSGAPQYIPLVENPAFSYTNVALRKTTAVSSGSGADKLTDGLFTDNSRWLPGVGYPQWAEINLGDDYVVDKVVFSQHTQRTGNYQVEAWNGSAWTVVASATGNTAQEITATFSPVATNKIRFVVTAGTYQLKVWELAVYGKLDAGVPLYSEDVGNPGVPGAASASGGVYTLQGSGDIYGATDKFQFLYQQMNGNGEVIAKVDSLQNINAWSKAGVMMRETLAGNARNAFTFVTPSSGAGFQRRLTVGASTTRTMGTGAAPYWVKLVRSGDTFTSYASANGTAWTLLGSASIPMAPTIYVGMAATSFTATSLAQGVFGNVTLPTPVPATYGIVSFGKTGTISSGTGADKLTDGLFTDNSRWMVATGYPQWAEINLGGNYTIDKVVFSQHTQRTSSYQIEVWNGSAWTVVASATGNTAQEITATFAPVTTSKVRFSISAGTYALKVWELSVYGIH